MNSDGMCAVTEKKEACFDKNQEHYLILIVDHIASNLSRCRDILSRDGHKSCFAQSGESAIKQAISVKPDLILLDIMLPDTNGFEVCRKLKADPRTSSIPIIFLTALQDEIDETEGFNAGAVDFMTKPVSSSRLLARVKNHLFLVQVDELEESRQLIVQSLGIAAEYKDNETGRHVMRMSHYSRILAKAYGLSYKETNKLYQAAPMHDIGKIGTPDNVLLKQGKLNAHEWHIMKQHPIIGAKIIGDHQIPILKAAKEIALSHHEKWDGSGYPFGLAGRTIPLFGRITAIADVFDALTSERPYKEAWSLEKTQKKMLEDAGKHFDPQLVKLFFDTDVFKEIKEIYYKLAEHAIEEEVL